MPLCHVLIVLSDISPVKHAMEYTLFRTRCISKFLKLLIMFKTHLKPLSEGSIYLNDLRTMYFDDLLLAPHFLSNATHQKTSTIPSQIEEKDDVWYIHLALPGIDKSAIELSIEDNLLTVSHDKDALKDKVALSTVNSFSRKYKLNKKINIENISAQMRQGILTITLPKTKEAKKVVKTVSISD